MDDFFDQVTQKSRAKNEIWSISFYANGQHLNCVNVPVQREDLLWKIKKRILKKLRYKNYTSTEL